MNDELIYRSKVDAWIAVTLGLAELIVLATLLLALREWRAAPMMTAFTALVVVVGAVLPLVFLARLRYTLSSDVLNIRCGPFHWCVPLAEIRSITSTRSALSSPALSLDRLRIDYGKHRWVMISPQDKEGFLRALENRRRALRQAS